MTTKIITKTIGYTAIFLLLNLSEKFLGLFGFSIALLFALLYCKENLFITLPTFAVSCMIINFNIPYLIIVSTVVLVVLIVAFVHYKIKRKFYLLENSILILITQIPIIIFSVNNPNFIAMTVVSLVGAVLFHYICIILFYSVLVRGLKYQLSAKEYLSAGVFIILLCVGLNTISIAKVSVYYFIATLVMLIFSNIDKAHLLSFACAMGLGASISANSLEYTAISCILALVCLALINFPTYIRAIGILFSFVIASYFLTNSFGLFNIIPPLIGCLFASVVPQKLYDRLHASRQIYQQKFALRTVVNHDREQISKRLTGISTAFNKMQQLLLEEEAFDESTDNLVYAVCDDCCYSCTRFGRCKEKMGDTAPAISQLVLSALDNGKATLLDAGIPLGENCTKLSKVIACVNDSVVQFRRHQEQKSGIEQGKEMVVSQLGGVSELLSELATSLNQSITFDTDLEKKLIEELGYANIIASDVVIYTANNVPSEITLVVRESDANKKILPHIISETVGYNMEELTRTKAVKEMLNLNYILAPKYKILYGESVISKEMRCGDTRQAIKIAPSKIMFILSDGMGTGLSAHNTSSHILMLIETFYKAGFSHKVIFSCLSRLLALRRKEDFSALDLAVVDTQTGDVDFIKQGGRESYIVSNKRLEIIEGGTLPLGIIEESKPLIERHRLRNNDFLILVSDGITDIMNEDDFSTLLLNFASNNPQDIADAITNNALHLSNGKEDDMTTMVVRLVHK